MQYLLLGFGLAWAFGYLTFWQATFLYLLVLCLIASAKAGYALRVERSRKESRAESMAQEEIDDAEFRAIP